MLLYLSDPQYSTAMETDPTKRFLVEEMNNQEFMNHLAGRQLAANTLNMSIENYAAKHLLLDQAIQHEKTCSESKTRYSYFLSISYLCTI